MLDNSQSSGSIRIKTRLVHILDPIYSSKNGNWSETLHLLRTSQYFVLCQVELVFPSKQGFVTKGLFWFLRSSLAKVARQRLRNQHKQTTFLFFWITNHTRFRILLQVLKSASFCWIRFTVSLHSEFQCFTKNEQEALSEN